MQQCGEPVAEPASSHMLLIVLLIFFSLHLLSHCTYMVIMLTLSVLEKSQSLGPMIATVLPLTAVNAI